MEKICEAGPTTDREGWIEKSKVKGTQENLFELMDENGDGQISQKEYEKIYKMMDENSDLILSQQEVRMWVTSHWHVLCRPYRPSIVGRLGQAERKD